MSNSSRSSNKENDDMNSSATLILFIYYLLLRFARLNVPEILKQFFYSHFLCLLHLAITTSLQQQKVLFLNLTPHFTACKEFVLFIFSFKFTNRYCFLILIINVNKHTLLVDSLDTIILTLVFKFFIEFCI